MTSNFKPTQIEFGDKYDGEKLRRLAQSVSDIANRVAAVATTAAGSTVPKNGSAGQVLTWLPATNAPGWAAPAAITSFPYANLTGVPVSFAPSPHVVATTTGLGPAHTVSGLTPGQVLKATGTQQAAFGFLLYSELGDVDTTGLSDGFVPAWSNANGKWQMVANGASFTGLTPGTIYTATSPTAAQFLPLSVTPAQVGTGVAQYGLGAPLGPLRDTAGTRQWASLNIPASDDTILAGDGSWKAIRDISISWAQLSDVPAMLPPPPGARGTAAFLRGDDVWATLRANDLGPGTPQFGINPQPSAPNRPLNGKQFRQLNLPQSADTLLTSLGWRAITDIDISWAQISNVPQQVPPYLGKATKFLRDDGTWATPPAGGGFTGYANPSALLGLSAINGAATTAMRSDAAPALDQSIAPTWTNPHVFSGGAFQTVTINGGANHTALIVQGSSTSGQSFGLSIAAGTTAADEAVLIRNQDGTRFFMQMFGDGSGTLGPTALLGLKWAAGGTVTILAPSGRNAFTSPTVGYTFGNVTDNPTYAFTGTGAFTIGSVANPAGPLNVGGVNQTNRFQDGGANGAIIEVFTTNTVVGLNTNWATTAPATSLRWNSSEYLGVNAAGSVMTFGGGLTNPGFIFQGTGTATFGGPVLVPAGSQTNPSLANSAHTGDGLYFDASGSLSLTFAGAAATTFRAGQVYAPNASAATPSYAFQSGPAMGMFRSSADVLGLATAGLVALTLDATQNALFAANAKVTGLTTPAGGLIQTHTPGSHTIADGYFGLYIDNVTLSGAQQLVLAGSSRLRIL